MLLLEDSWMCSAKKRALRRIARGSFLAQRVDSCYRGRSLCVFKLTTDELLFVLTTQHTKTAHIVNTEQHLNAWHHAGV